MGKIYVGQSALTLKLDTEVDLSTATDPRIYYLKPVSGLIGYWVGSKVETTKIKYDVVDALQLNEAGVWVFWAYALFETKVIYGESVKRFIFTPGE